MCVAPRLRRLARIACTAGGMILSVQASAAPLCPGCFPIALGPSAWSPDRVRPLRRIGVLRSGRADVGRRLFSGTEVGSASGDITERGKRFGVEWDHGSVSLDAARRYVRGAAWGGALFRPRDRMSAWAVGLRYDNDVGGSDAASIGVAGMMDRRRFAFDLAEGRWSRSYAVRAEASWVHGAQWRLSAGYDVTGGGGASGIRRSIELVEGAPVNARGFRLAAEFSPAGFDRAAPLSIGVDLRRMNLTSADTNALGIARGVDRRLMASFTARF